LANSGHKGRRGAAGRILAPAALAAVCLLPLAARAQGEKDAPVSLHTSFDYFWRRYLLAASAGDAETSSRMLGELRRLRVERNAFDLHDIGLNFAYQGFAHLEGGNLEEARRHFDIARELAPDLPTAYWGLARLSEQEGSSRTSAPSSTGSGRSSGRYRRGATARSRAGTSLSFCSPRSRFRSPSSPSS
jgi:hypothetical protein